MTGELSALDAGIVVGILALIPLCARVGPRDWWPRIGYADLD